ncbi:hypothetical protein [Vogesella indigofera]|uniref:hypothetical protein n=1 Tax=Vogesella indigofera TaxID=45465 RepID=UPI003F438238
MPSREFLIQHLQHLLQQVESSETDNEAWQRVRHDHFFDPWWDEYSLDRFDRLDRKLDELLKRSSNAMCRYSGEGDGQIVRLITGVGELARVEAVRYLNQCLSGARQLTICDPYFLQPYGRMPKANYVAAIKDVIPKQVSQIELFVKPRKRDAEVAEGFNEFCKERSIKLTCRRTDAIHDRVWIVDSSRAYVVGTSFNGLGNKCAFILDLPDEDMRGFFKEIGFLREQTTRSKSA